MKPEPPDPLLCAVLDDDAAFRQSTLAQTLALARQRRFRRVTIRATAAAALLAGVAFLLRPPTPTFEPKPIAAESTVRIIRTMPLAVGQPVRTKGADLLRITSGPSQIAVVTSQPRNFVRIETTTSAPMLDFLNDQQLLAAFPGQHPALIAPGTAEARLIFY